VENAGDVWHRALADRVGRAVLARRKAIGMTAQQVAARCEELRAPIHRTTITKIENGRARFDLGELIVLAAALRVSPLRLLFPNVLELVEILPDVTIEGTDALDWFIGQGSGSDASHFGVLSFGDDAIRFAIRIAEIERRLAYARHSLATAERGLELNAAGSIEMADGLETVEQENIKNYKRQIKLLEIEHKNRVTEYKRIIGGGND
jgi:transcriptional regulator with XRE-family HTH domain